MFISLHNILSFYFNIFIPNWQTAGYPHQQPVPRDQAGAIRKLRNLNRTPGRKSIFVVRQAQSRLPEPERGGIATVYDNISTLPDWLSNGLCGLSTGGGISMRGWCTNHQDEKDEGLTVHENLTNEPIERSSGCRTVTRKWVSLDNLGCTKPKDSGECSGNGGAAACRAYQPDGASFDVPRIFSAAPKGQPQISPGQRPGDLEQT